MKFSRNTSRNKCSIEKSFTFTQNDDGSNYLSLTDKEKDISEMIVRGYRNKEIADKLNISVSTVNVHVCNILRKLNIDSRTQIITAYYVHKFSLIREYTDVNI